VRVATHPRVAALALVASALLGCEAEGAATTGRCEVTERGIEYLRKVDGLGDERVGNRYSSGSGCNPCDRDLGGDNDRQAEEDACREALGIPRMARP
jgi:hypothetical protein